VLQCDPFSLEASSPSCHRRLGVFVMIYTDEVVAGDSPRSVPAGLLAAISERRVVIDSA
jgi:hypothetical protein